MKKAIRYVCLKNPETRNCLTAWWETLNRDRAARARLKRAEHPDDVLLTEPFFSFLQKMPDDWSRPEKLETSALVSAALAHVKTNVDEAPFASQLASPKKGGYRPRVSELRFQQLQKSDTPTIFFRRLLRTIRLAESKVNVCSLADSILHWMQEYKFGVDREPINRLAVRWAGEYYTTIRK